MIIKDIKFDIFTKKIFKALNQNFKSYKKILLIALIFIIYHCVLAIVLYNSHKLGYLKVIKNSLLERSSVLNKITTNDNLSHIQINIDPKNYQILKYNQKSAVKKYSLKEIENRYVGAQLVYQGKKIPIDIKLKGSTALEHSAHWKKSYRIKIKGFNNIFGMKDFAIMAPERRNFLFEWLLRKIMKKEGVISKKYGFIKVSINDEKFGLYAYDERPSKIAIESNKKREGPIIRLNSHALWLEKAAYETGALSPAWTDYFYSADVEALDMEKILNNKELFSQFIQAKNNFNLFREGKLSVEKVFDVNLLSKFLAVSAITGGMHGAIVFNSFFYYNPITGLLEPIPDDSWSEVIFYPERKKINLSNRFYIDEFTRLLFKDLDFLEMYLSELRRLSNKKYTDKLFKDLEVELSDLNKVFKIYYPRILNIKEITKKGIQVNQEKIRLDIEPSQIINSYLKKIDQNEIIISVASTKNTLPVEIISLEFYSKELDISDIKKKNVNNKQISFPIKKIVLSENSYAKPKIYHEISLKNINLSNFLNKFDIDYKNISNLYNKLILNYKVLGSNNTRLSHVQLYPGDLAFSEEILNNPKIEELFKFDFIKIDEAEKSVSFSLGDHIVKQNIIIPRNYKVKIFENTKINLVNNASIISYSPISFLGSEKKPIEINGNSSNFVKGGGLAILSNKKRSLFKNVIFKNLSNPKNNLKNNFLGAINIYESEIEIIDCKFIGNDSEDFLNIISSNFSGKNLIFQNTNRDAIDVDFSEGMFKNIRFYNVGNDALDFSNSKVIIENISILDVKDKGISVGEASVVEGKNIYIDNAKYGIASKDDSVVKLNDVKIVNSNIAVSAYQKKPEFGPGNIEIIDIYFKNNKKNVDEEKGSNIVVLVKEIN
jgi:hypothetical protein